MTPCYTLPATAACLASHLRTLGFVPGLPACVPPAILDLDRASYRRCPACRFPCREVQPWHRGEEYRLIASCDRCGLAEEC
jgi:hypothetical protein